MDQWGLFRVFLGKLTRIYDYEAESSKRWVRPRTTGAKLDQLAIDDKGRLVLVELKDANKHNPEIYYSPFQLLQYIWKWNYALEVVRNELQTIIDARVSVELAPRDIPRLTGGIRAAVCLANDNRSLKVKRRYGIVLEVVNQHLPDGVGPIETWEYTEAGPMPVP